VATDWPLIATGLWVAPSPLSIERGDAGFEEGATGMAETAEWHHPHPVDEPESLGAISLAGREKLDNLIFVVGTPNPDRRPDGRLLLAVAVIVAAAGAVGLASLLVVQ
jgi:hypothetical protein